MKTVNTESAIPLNHVNWHLVTLPVGNLSKMEVLRTLSFSACPARFKGMSNDSVHIEILGATPEAIAATEIQLRQALADQQLRKEINQKSSSRIYEIVEAVIAKVTGH